MEVTHPRAGEAPLPSAVTVNGEDYPISDGAADVPASVADDLADAWGRRFGVDPATLVREEDGPPDTCETVKADGEVCGRELPCPYHSDDDSGGGDTTDESENDDSESED